MDGIRCFPGRDGRRRTREHGYFASNAQGEGYYHRRLSRTERGRASSEPEREAGQHRTHIAVLASWKLRIRPAGQIPAHDDAHHVGYACNRREELPNLQYGLSGYAGRSGMVRKLRRRPVLCAVFTEILGAAAFYLVID